jgi:hypothetical protein
VNSSIGKSGLAILLMVFMVLAVFVSGASTKEYPTLHRGVRPLGMGGAFTAVADDENALFYNPAGLSEISTLQLGIFNPLIEASKGTIDMLNDAQDTDFDDIGETTDFLRDYVGEHEHARVALFPHVGFNVFGFGAMVGGIGQAAVDLEVRNPVWPEAHIDMVVDTGLVGGAGGRLPLTGLRAGASIKMISRDSLEEVYTATDIAADDFDSRFDDDQNSGSGVSLDLGAIYTLPWVQAADLDVGLAIQNVPSMDMGDARDIDTQANLGFALKKQFLKFRLLGAVDYMDVTKAIGEDEDFGKRLHMGVEFQLPVVLSVRAGLNQGYYTLGATADVWIFQFDVATYGEEVGSYAGQREDRRYLGQITIGW